MIQNALLAGVPVFSCDLFCSLTLIKLSTLCRISYLSNSTYLISTFTFTGFGSTHVRSETTFSTLHCKCQNNLFFLLLGPIAHGEFTLQRLFVRNGVLLFELLLHLQFQAQLLVRLVSPHLLPRILQLFREFYHGKRPAIQELIRFSKPPHPT